MSSMNYFTTEEKNKTVKKNNIKKDIRLVATDMDGTLLNSRKEMPIDFMDWVRAHPQIKTVIASGRQYFTLEADFLSVRDKLIFVAENGSLVFDQGEIIYMNEMTQEDVCYCLDMLAGVPYANPIACGTKAAYIQNPSKEAYENAAMYYRSLVVTDNLKEAIKTDHIVKIAIYFDAFKAGEMVDQMILPSDGHLKAVYSSVSWIDIANASVNKGEAIRSIQKQYGISPDESMAFGDFLNDYELLLSCTESYCMVNGHEDLKKIAKYITTSNDEDGVMAVLRKI